MYDERARALLKQPLIARISTIDSSGYPHTIPVWFMLDGDDLVIFGYAATKKFDYAKQNPKGSLLVGGDPEDMPGYLIKGDWQVEADNGWSKKITYFYAGSQEAGDKQLSEWGDIEYAVLRLKPTKVIKVS